MDLNELTYQINGAVYEVNRVLGGGFLEIKAIESLGKIHEAQLLHYLRATGYKIGLLINFTHPKAAIKRFVL